jgi:hypothetical protein
MYFAHKYIWWQTPESAVTSPHRIIAQVMNLGTFEDAQALLASRAGRHAGGRGRQIHSEGEDQIKDA